jgi:hypothetical protein
MFDRPGRWLVLLRAVLVLVGAVAVGLTDFPSSYQPWAWAVIAFFAVVTAFSGVLSAVELGQAARVRARVLLLTLDAVVAIGFVAIFSYQTGEPWRALYLIPIAAAALRFGLLGGLIGGAVMTGSTVVIDARPAFATRERFPDADELLVGWADELAESVALGPDDAVAVLTHDPALDDPAIADALRRGCRYVGAIGSRRTQAVRRERLRAAGVTDDDLARLRGPIGLDLGGRDPAETALAIMAEVVAARYGASGMPMRDRRDRSATSAGAERQQEPLQRVAQ